MEERKNIMIRKYKECIIYGGLAFCILSIGVIWTKGPDIGVDTHKYIEMQDYLPPLYPLFLMVLRTFFGETWYLEMAVLLQTIFATVSIICLWKLIIKKFRVSKLFEIVIYILLVLTFFKVDELDWNSNLWILTEGLSYPLFLLSVYFSINFIYDRSLKCFFKLCIISVLLTLCRAQFLICFGMLVVFCIFLLLYKKITWKKTILFLFCVFMSLTIVNLAKVEYRKVAVKTNVESYSKLSNIAHLFYYVEYSDGMKIQDDKERALFYKIYEEVKDKEYLYDANEAWLDEILSYRNQFLPVRTIIEDAVKEYVAQRGIVDISEAYQIENEVLDNLLEAVEVHFGKWGWVAMKQLPATLARGIALYYEPLGELCVLYAIVFYTLYAIFNVVLAFKMKRLTKENIFCIFVTIFTFMNAVVSQMMIRSIMRYVAYSFGIFYISGLLVMIELYRQKG